MQAFHDAYRQAERRGLFNRLVTLVRACANVVVLESVMLRGLTQGDNGQIHAMVAHQYSPFQLHPYPIDMIEELQ